MNKKERAQAVLESELDSIVQSIYCNPECYKCQYRRRLKKLMGAVRVLMDYGEKTKNTTLQSFNDMKDKRSPQERRVYAGPINKRVSQKKPGYVRDFFTGEWIRDVNDPEGK